MPEERVCAGRGGGLHIEVDDLTRPQVRALLAEHLAEMRAQSPPESVHALDLGELSGPGITVWSCWSGDALLGVLALKELPGPADPTTTAGELKAMRVARHARGRGVARALLEEVLGEAWRRGMVCVRLETGTEDHFAPARQLYLRRGFRVRGPFGDYSEDPLSVYMELAPVSESGEGSGGQ